MRKKIIFLITFLFLASVTGCGKYDESDIIKDLEKKIEKSSSYKLTGRLEITNNDDTFQYDVNVGYKKDDNYRVSLINKSNNHEQIILKNSDGVYVITPSLNKSFKFQSEWPHNNSQIYLMHSLLNDIKKDDGKKFEQMSDSYVFTTKVNYPNNSRLVSQKIIIDKQLNFKSVEIMNSNGITQMIMEFDSIDFNSDFSEDYFDLNSIIEEIEPEESNQTIDKNTNTETDSEENSDENLTSNEINDIIYPLYIPTGTSLTEQEKVSTTDGERIILTFDGEKPFLLVEETSSISNEFSIIPTFGEPYFFVDTIGALTDNSLSWSSNGIDYYIVSEAMSQIELIEIASSISAIPTIK